MASLVWFRTRVLRARISILGAAVAALRLRLKVLLSGVMIYLSIAGLVTFSLFILEESFQTVMFGTWPAQDAKDWRLVSNGCDHMERIADLIDGVNKYAGWIQPLAYLSYGEYAKSARFYLAGIRAKVFAFRPDLLVGRDFSFEFTPRSVIETEHGLELINGAVKVLVDHRPEAKSFYVVGRVVKDGDGVCIDMRTSLIDGGGPDGEKTRSHAGEKANDPAYGPANFDE